MKKPPKNGPRKRVLLLVNESRVIALPICSGLTTSAKSVLSKRLSSAQRIPLKITLVQISQNGIQPKCISRP